MPAEVEPPELALVVDFAERPRAGDWSLRSALVRYAQPQPVRVGALLEVVRRIEWALKSSSKVIEREGRDLWAAVENETGDASGAMPDLVELLRATAQLDQFADILVEWAIDRSVGRPDAEVDAITAGLARRLDAIGVPREDRERPPRARR